MTNDVFNFAGKGKVPLKQWAILFLLSAIVIATVGTPAISATSKSDPIDWWQMGVQLFGGLAIFLFGMEQMSESLKMVAGSRMKDVLARLTGNRFMGLGTGAFVTAIIQSSSVTTVMLVGFVATGLMSLSQAVGVILGANIGTTITAQIVAFKVTKYALIFVSGGFLMSFTAKNERIKHYGFLIMGLGLIFFGMGIMSAGMKPLRTYEPFIDLMGSVSNPLIGIAVAAAFTGLVQSSSATMGVIIALALQGLISLEGGIALAFGANVGTCVTAGLAAIGKSREAVRVAVAHVAFNIMGVLVFVWFIPIFADIVRTISPASPNLSGIERLAAETPRQIANAHSIFNVGIAFLFLPFAGVFARFCEWVVKDRPIDLEAIIRPQYLDKELLSTPSLALDRARLEIAHLATHVERMVDAILPTALTGSASELQSIAEMDANVDDLHGHIVTYLGKISVRTLSEDETDTLMRLFTIVKELEEIGDIVETGMVMLGLRRIAENITVSAPTLERITDYHRQVQIAFELMSTALKEEDATAVKNLKAMKQDIARIAEQTARHEVQRLSADEPNRLQTYTREIETIDYLTDIFRHCRRIAKTIKLPPKQKKKKSSKVRAENLNSKEAA